MNLLPVEIAGTGRFLPGLPVTNDQLESVLGRLDDAPADVRRFVEVVGPRMLQRSGINARHFAIDADTHEITHSFAALAEEACRRALAAANMQPAQIDLLVLAAPGSDHYTPPTSTLLQERLGIEACAELEIHSNCTGVGKGMLCAHNALRTGQYRTALVVYSQLSSIYLRSEYFNPARIDKAHATLRWILADGAGALVLRAVADGAPQHEIIGTFAESLGAGRPAGMTSGGGAADLLKAGATFSQIYESGAHHLWQDFAAVNEQAPTLLLEGMLRFVDKLELDPSAVDHYVFSIPTRKLYQDSFATFDAAIGGSAETRAKFRSADIGYCGGAATLIHFDDMARVGEFQPGQLIVVHAIESSKWMTAGFAVRW